jgi:hypothetical protein
VAGEVVVTAGGGENSSSAGTLLTFAPGERQAGAWPAAALRTAYAARRLQQASGLWYPKRSLEGIAGHAR